LETDKTTVDLRAETSGKITRILAEVSAEVGINQDYIEIDTSVQGTSTQTANTVSNTKETKDIKVEVAKENKEVKFEVKENTKAPAQKNETEKVSTPKETKNDLKTTFSYTREEKRLPLNKMRQTISNRLKQSQNENATLTTFNECDMNSVMNLRTKYQDQFVKKHQIKLGLMGFFLRASTIALQEMPVFNSYIENNSQIVQRNYIDISVAVSSPTGLLVPVIRNCSGMNFAEFETELVNLGKKAKDGKITIEDMQGGNFTISNGGIYGSMLGTPIINPPQSAILGLHNIVNRPTCVGKEILARPIMYLALSYDHRLVDGREAVTFLKRIKELVEEPEKMMLDI
jgi:2-oxoglutarate dehydrogenase E2 component (dihydrolipoamide succinyltransferase)